MVIYLIKNIANNKVYVGKTEVCLSIRKKKHLELLKVNKHYNAHLQRAYNKNGIESFSFVQIDRANSKESLNNLERFYIKLYLSKNDKFGYNISDGGDGSAGRKLNQEQRKRISESHKGLMAGEKHPFFGKKLSKDHKKKISESRKKVIVKSGPENPLFGRKNPAHSLRMKGKKQSAEAIKNRAASMSLSLKGKLMPRYAIEASVLKNKKICMAHNEDKTYFFSSHKVACNYLDANKGNLYRAKKSGKKIKGFYIKEVKI